MYDGCDRLCGREGREMFFEGWKRQDMIRFGTYNSAWRFHPGRPVDNLRAAWDQIT